jgi:hypothetical protein
MTTSGTPAFVRSHKGGTPWASLDPALAPPLRATLPALVEETIEAVRTAVPVYARDLDGPFGEAVRLGVEQALGGFVELIAAGPDARLPARGVYVALGRGEARSGRSLDALLGAYRAGAQLAWRRFAEAAGAAGASPEALIGLAEAVFAFIDELSAATAEGHAQAQAQAAGERSDRRRRLLELVLRDPAPDAAELAPVAAEAGWRVPAAVAVITFVHAQPGRVAARLATDVLIAETEPGRGVALVPDPAAPGRAAELGAAFRRVTAALGPAVPLASARRSAARAEAALRLPRAEDAGLVRAEEHLLDLTLLADPGMTRELVAHRLAPLRDLDDTTRERLTETLAAWLDHHGEVRPAAEALHVHVQTVRYRLAQLRELFGPALDDPAARLEITVALRAEPLLT